MKNYVKEHKGRKVPEGAVYYGDGNQCFYNANKSEFHSSVYSKWKPISCTVTARLAVELPEAPQEWNGEGLPPVGTICLTMHRGDLVECLYVGKGLGAEYIYQVSSGVYRGEIDRLIGSPRFRPLKTQQEKDREAFIDACFTASCALHNNANENVFSDLFDADFKAPKAADNDQK